MYCIMKKALFFLVFLISISVLLSIAVLKKDYQVIIARFEKDLSKRLFCEI